MSNQEKVARIIAVAESLIGTPYLYGSPAGDTQSFDCSSFVQHIFKEEANIDLPRSALLQAGDSRGLEIDHSKPEKWLPGDLLFMRGSRGHYNDDLFNGQPIDIGHVMIYVGPDEIIHAKGQSHGVIKQNVGELKDQINYVKRFIF